MFTKTSVRARVHSAIERSNVKIRRERRPDKVDSRGKVSERSDRRITKDNWTNTGRNKWEERDVRSGERKKEKGSIFKRRPRDTRRANRGEDRSFQELVQSR